MKKVWIGALLAVLVIALSLAAFADAGPEITHQPSNIEAAVGETGAATVVAESSGELQYQWYYRSANGSAWQASGMSGAQTDTIRVPVLERRFGQQYKCVLTDEQGISVETDIIEVVNAERSSITISEQPGDIVARLGGYGTAAVTAEADTGAELRYKWYYKAVNSESWKASGFAGSDTPAITVQVTTARLGQQYKCVITTADGGRAETVPVQVVKAEPAGITIISEPTDITAGIGSEGTATVVAESAAPLSYKWYFKGVNKTSWQASGFAGCDTPTITVPVTTSRLGQQYKCVITTDEGVRVESRVVTVSEPDPCVITIEKQPGDIVAAIGKKGSATVTASSDLALSYKWYYKSVNSSSWQASGFAGCATDTITVPVTAARIGQQYKCVITAANGASKETDIITVREAAALSVEITRNPCSFVTLSGQPIQLDAAAKASAADGSEGQYEICYQWYRNDVAVEGATDSTLMILSLTQEDAGSYYCVASVNGVTATSKTGTVEVLELSELLDLGEPEEPQEPNELREPELTAQSLIDLPEETDRAEEALGTEEPDVLE